MGQKRIISFKDACGVALFMSGMFLLLLWIEVRKDLGWPDVAVAISSGAVFTSAISVIRHFTIATSLWFAQRRVVRFFTDLALYSCIFALACSIPMADRYFLHPQSPMRHGMMWLVSFSTWMGVWHTIFKGFQTLCSRKPGENDGVQSSAEMKATSPAPTASA